jgi:hypothetical protein
LLEGERRGISSLLVLAYVKSKAFFVLLGVLGSGFFLLDFDLRDEKGRVLFLSSAFLLLFFVI